MNPLKYLSPVCLALCGGALIFARPVTGGETFTMNWQESGLTAKTGGMRPKGIPLSDTAPAGIKKAPAGLVSPRYGSFKLGPSGAQATYVFILDEQEGKPSKLYVDANANGDLTDDAACDLKPAPSHDPEGNDATTYSGSALVEIPFASGPRRGQVKFYMVRAETGSKYAEGFKKSLSIYADYGLVGDVKIGDRVIAAALQDAGNSGDFRLDGGVMETPIFWLALANGPRHHVGQSFIASRPFQVDGQWWALTNLTHDGAFEITASAKPADADKQRKLPEVVDLTGKKAPAFTGPLLGGKTVNFPDDYKGKIVLLDFWATWCGPCVAEIPNVVKNYEIYHGRGFEVLGVSLDREGMEQKLDAFTKKKNMPWPQVYDGKFWDAATAKLYQIHAIPHMMLIDGDTGTVLDDDNLRGEALAPAIEKALAGKKK